jgi:hypothetical protein
LSPGLGGFLLGQVDDVQVVFADYRVYKMGEAALV